MTGIASVRPSRVLNAVASDVAGGVTSSSPIGGDVAGAGVPKSNPAGLNGVGVEGNGIVARGAGVAARIAPVKSAVVREAKCPGTRPPVLQRR
jgi:hypothetical protein